MSNHCTIEGLDNSNDICHTFANHFNNNFVDSGANKRLMNEFWQKYENYDYDSNNVNNNLFTVDGVEEAIHKLAKKKAPGVDHLYPEHLIYAVNNVAKHLLLLFNACIVHGCVPDSFTCSVIVPVIKDKMGDNSICTNYRPIALVTILSKVFENCLAKKLKLEQFFDPLQYGFTNSKGCQKALLSVECIINYFTCRGSSIYLATLDASKAFDRVNHYSLFLALMEYNIPFPFLKVIVYWHLHLKGMVKWNSCFSNVFEIKSGIRQGGVMSPGYFNIYINDLIIKLRMSGLGCYLAGIYCGCLFFADDIILLSASVAHLQLMLNICSEFAATSDLNFNNKKSHLMKIGPILGLNLPSLILGGDKLDWVDEVKYLGVVFNAGKKLTVDVNVNCRKFLGASFAILQKCKYLSEEILCKLILTNCLPMLLYGIDSICLKVEQVRKMSVVFNTVFRRIFHMSRFSSMRLIYSYIGTKTLDYLYHERLISLHSQCCISEFDLLRCCANLRSSQDDIINICLFYDVHINMNFAFIKKQICFKFKDSLNLRNG